jgi:4-diphosphocytidyl-2-C-methyl-D-erythritol kinase
MPPLYVEAPCKLNLFLEVLGKRADGYHEIVTVMESIDAGDEVVIQESEHLVVTADRKDVPSGPDNLAWRMVREAERWLNRLLPARIEIHKGVPPGSGLGGGSTDAAAALRGVFALHGCRLPPALQRELCATIGSDIPFFVNGGTAICTGRGEQVQPINAGRARHYVLVFGGPATSTREVYGGLRIEGPRRGASPLIEALSSGRTVTPELLFNRLEDPAVSRYPELAALKKSITEAAGRPPHLSGSGSAWFLSCGSMEEAGKTVERLKVRGLDARVVRTRPAWGAGLLPNDAI